MNIQSIVSERLSLLSKYDSKQKNIAQYGNLKLTKPLACDTVVFKARGKKLISPELRAAIARKEARALRDARQIADARREANKTAPTKKSLAGDERTWGVSLELARKIHNNILEPQRQIHDFAQRIFGDLVVTELNPKNLLFEVKDRAKGAISIMEKSATRKLNTENEILEIMTDLNGLKTVMNYKAGKIESEMVLSRYIPLIKTGQVRLREIELQRPEGIKHMSPKDQEEFDYVTKDFLDRLEDAQEEVLNGMQDDVDKIILIDRPLPKYTKGNYCALHLLLELVPNGLKNEYQLLAPRIFEHQHSGIRVAKGKRLDDLRYKFFDGKELHRKYNDLVKLWTPLKSDENQEAKERFLQYYRDANLQLRVDEIHENKTQRILNRPTGLFKTQQKYNLPPEYDLNKQYQMMLDDEIKHELQSKRKTTKPSSSSVKKTKRNARNAVK